MRKNLLEQPPAEQTPPTETALQTDTPKAKAAEKPKAKAAEKPKYFYTDPAYTVKEGEENDVHVLIAREFHKGIIDNRTQIEVKESLQILDPKSWLSCREQWPKQGWIFVKMLHVPTEMPTGFASAVTVAE